MPLPAEGMRLLVIAALNGHVGYAWWRMFSDVFDVKVSDYSRFTLPDAWLEGEERNRALAFGQALVEAIPHSHKAKKNAGKEWPNVDFFEYQPGLIAELDRFHLESLGLNPTELLPHLHRMRSPDGWDFASLP